MPGRRTLHRLNATVVKAMKAANAGTHEDGGGLRLLVTDKGAKRWVLRISQQGKRYERGLGSYPAVSLERARAKAAAIRTAAKDGKDVKTEQPGRGRRTFRQAFETHFEIKGLQLTSARHHAQWRSTMEAYVFPIIGDEPVAEVGAGDILNVLMPIWFTRPETARRVLQRLEAVFKSAILRGHRTRASPCIGVADELGTRHREVVHHRALAHAEIPEFIARLQAIDAWPASKLALEWLILTATRSGETRLARWVEIDEPAALWTVPASRMRKRRMPEPHVIPLPPRCLAILQAVRAAYPSAPGDWLFPSTKAGTPMGDVALTRLLGEMGYTDLTTVHGFRSTFKIWCAEVAKVRDEVSEAALAHAIPGKVRAAYLRANFLEERRQLMPAWAMYCTDSALLGVPANTATTRLDIAHQQA
jgi:integrase